MPPNSFYIKPRDLAADFRQGSARAHVSAGRYDDAARTIGGDDPAQAASYAQMADRERANLERADARAYGRSYADALHRRDYGAAGEAAARYGDPEGVASARTAQTEEMNEEQRQLQRAAAGYWAQLRQIEDGEGAGWEEMVQRARQAVSQNPDMHPELRALAESLPDEYNPRAVRGVRARVESLMFGGMDEDEIGRMVREDAEGRRNQRRNLSPEEVRAAGLQPGTVAQTDGSGQIYVVQQPRANAGGAPSGYGSIPSGYRVTEDGSLEAIPGGPAAARVESAEQKRMSSLLDALTNNNNVMAAIDDADRLSRNAGLGGATGLNSLTAGMPGTNSNALSAALETIEGNIGFDRLQEMRMNSPTGGALGAVSERELRLLSSVVASLRQSQNNDQFRRNLQRVRDQYVRSMQAIRAAYEQDYGPMGEGEIAPAAPPVPGPTNAPQPGQIEDGFRFKGGDPGDPNNWEPVR